MRRRGAYVHGVVAFGFALAGAVAAPVSAEEPTAQPRVEVTRLSDRLVKLVCRGRPAANVVASIGPDGVLLVDTAFASTAPALRAALDGLGGGDVRYIVNTHRHDDHSGGNALLGAKATIIAHDNARSRMSGRYFALPPLRIDGLPQVTFSDRLTLYFNGEEVQVIHLPGGHTDGDAVVHFTGAGVVAMGDLLLSDMFPYVAVPEGGNAVTYAANQQALIDRLPSGVRLVPGHGDDYSVDDLRRYHQTLVATIDRVREGFAAGRTAEELRQAGILRPWAAWDTNAFAVPTNSDRWVDWVWASLAAAAGARPPSICTQLTETLVSQGVDAAVARYRLLRSTQPTAYNFAEEQLNQLGYELLARDSVAEAIAFFALNVEAYPGSSNVYDSLGEAYMTHGDRELAIANYERSLALDPSNRNAVAMLERLRQGAAGDPRP
jgi:cyclase